MSDLQKEMPKFWTILIVTLCCFSSVRCGNETDNLSVIELHRLKRTTLEEHLYYHNFMKEAGINPHWLFKKHHNHTITNDSIALYRFLDNEFYGTIVIGHPGQSFNVAFDTAWSRSWIISEDCLDSKNTGCQHHKKYDHKKSSEWKKDGQPFNDTSVYQGYYSYDNISFAHSDVKGYRFVEMTKVPDVMAISKIDGVLGLGLEEEGYVPFFYTWLNQHKNVTSRIFSIYLNRDKSSNKGGSIFLGGIEMRHVHSEWINDKRVFDDIKYMPLKPGSFWQFDLDKINVDYKREPFSFCDGKNCTAIADTGSNNIIGPADDVALIHDAISAKPENISNFIKYVVDCDKVNILPVITFTIGGQDFKLKGRDYIIKMKYDLGIICVSAFVPAADYKNYWVLGGAFLSEYYTIYNLDEKKIGFVKAA